MSNLNNELQALIEIKELIARPYGWTRNALSRKVHGVRAYCILGATHHVCSITNRTIHNYPMSYKMEDRLKDCLKKKYKRRYPTLSQFNDAPRTKKKDVLELIDCAIDDVTKAKHEQFDSLAQPLK